MPLIPGPPGDTRRTPIRCSVSVAAKRDTGTSTVGPSGREWSTGTLMAPHSKP